MVVVVPIIPSPTQDLEHWRTSQPHKAVIILPVLKMKLERGAAPAVQWLRACRPTQAPPAWFPAREDPVCRFKAIKPVLCPKRAAQLAATGGSPGTAAKAQNSQQ